RPVPNELDRHAALSQLGRARIPDRHHVDLAVADELLRLIAFPPPHFDMRLDPVERLEGALHVQRIKPLARHTVGQQSKDHTARYVADAQAAVARKSLDVPEIGP